MSDLYDKIEQLRKALTSFKSKSQQNSLVPALTMPSVKPLSMPSAGAAKPIELPGAAPKSKKDPKKIAEQIKSGKMTSAPKMDILKAEEPMYALHVDGHRVGDWAPMKHHMQSASTMATIKQNPNHKLLPQKSAAPVKVAKNGQWSLD
jgi:hypothetical protein